MKLVVCVVLYDVLERFLECRYRCDTRRLLRGTTRLPDMMKRVAITRGTDAIPTTKAIGGGVLLKGYHTKTYSRGVQIVVLSVVVIRRSIPRQKRSDAT